MLQARRILFPTDCSENAERAYAHAAFLAHALGAELHALYVRRSDTPKPPATDLLPLSWSDIVEELDVPAESTADGFDREQVRQVDLTGESPSEGILRYAGENGIDLIVMGTRGRSGGERLLAGSVAERVVREAPCPVLTVRAGGSPTIRRIIVPIDFSERSTAVLPTARSVAQLYGASLELLYVLDEDDLPLAHVPLLGPVKVSRDEVEARFRRLMKELVRKQGSEIPVKGTVYVGHPAHDIPEYAAANADLVVMATHGRTGLERFFLGSVAEKVIRRAPCPVLTVRSFGRA